jgi:Ca2+-binding EF-hand superfamily protein
MKIRIATAVLLAACLAPAAADDKAEYQRRAAAADQAAFRDLDLDRDGRLTLEEVRSDLNFGPRFNDADVNRDGVVTPDEMRRYLEQSYGTPDALK